MRTATSQFKTHIAGETTTLARLWVVTRKDGTIYRFTDNNQAIVFSGNTYRCDISFTLSAILLSSSIANAQTVSVEVALDDTALKENDIRNRLFDGATGEVFVINYADTSMGAVSLFKGTFGKIKITDKHRCIIEMRPAGANGKSLAFQQYSQTCRNSLGDAGCTVNITALKQSITVTTVSGNVVVASALTQADDNWALGYIKWLTGNNAGTVQAIQSSNKATTSVTLNALPALPIQVGDTADVYPGCNKYIETCLNKFNNKNKFDGEPFVPKSNSVTFREVASVYIPPPVA